MAVLTVHNLPDEVYRALHELAQGHGRSTEAEVRAILEDAVKSKKPLKLGSLLLDIGKQAQLTNEEAALLTQRDQTTHSPVSFE